MAKYLILIYGDEQRWDAMGAAELRAIDEGHRTFRERAGAAVTASGQLDASGTAQTLRAGQDGPVVSDGPFMETKEVVGGFYVVEAADLDEAVSLASCLDEVRQDHSGVQVHPLINHS